MSFRYLTERIAAENPQIADQAREGKTMREIIENNNFYGKYGFKNFDRARFTTRRALARLISKDELEILLRRDQREQGIEGAKTKGLTPWNEKERDQALELRGLGISYPMIAEVLNEMFYEGKKVRTASAVGYALTK